VRNDDENRRRIAEIHLEKSELCATCRIMCTASNYAQHYSRKSHNFGISSYFRNHEHHRKAAGCV